MNDDLVAAIPSWYKTLTQTRGIDIFGLTPYQVETPNFGEHTLYFMEVLINFSRCADYETAFSMLEELNMPQCFGVCEFQLSKNQVQTSNFGEHTNRSIHALSMPPISANYQAAFARVEGLDEAQCDAVVKFQLTREQVLTPEFRVIVVISALSHQDYLANYEATFAKVEGLDFNQAFAILEFQLSKEQVQSPNFGFYTGRAIWDLICSNCVKNGQEAFQMIKELNSSQLRGIFDYQLTEKEVAVENFGSHTIFSMDILKMKYPAKDYHKIFAMIKGLDRIKSQGVRDLDLTREQVLKPNFGDHTITSMFTLMGQKRVKNTKEAFTMLEGLGSSQARGISNFQLTREQVKHPLYNEEILETMWQLHAFIPRATGPHLYETAMSMNPHQRRGIVEFKLRLEQVGIRVYDNQFELEDFEHISFLEGTLKNLEFLSALNTETTTQRGSFDFPINISLSQVSGLVDFGLSVEQLNTQLFKDSGVELLHQLTYSYLVRKKVANFYLLGEGYFPLSKEEQCIARKEFDEILENSNKEVSKETTDIVNNFNSTKFTEPINKIKNGEIEGKNSPRGDLHKIKLEHEASKKGRKIQI